MFRRFALVAFSLASFSLGLAQTVNIPFKVECDVPYLPKIDHNYLDSIATYKIDSLGIKKDFQVSLIVYYSDSAGSFLGPIRGVFAERGPFSKLESPVFPALESCVKSIKWIRTTSPIGKGCDVALMVVFKYVHKTGGVVGPSRASTYVRLFSYQHPKD